MIATLLWGATFTIVHDAVAVYGVLSFLAVRFLIASVALGIIGARRMSLRTLLVGGAVGSALAAGFVLQTIGLRLRTRMKEARAAEAQATARGPAKGNRQQRAQRKSFRGKSSGQRKKRFGRRCLLIPAPP